MVDAYKVLVIDDSPTAREVARDHLEALGMHVTTVGDPLDGISLVKSELFDLIFLDIDMPAMSGLDLLPRLRRLQPTAKIVMLTGRTDADSFDEALGDELFGADGFINKPFEEGTFLNCIETVMERGGKYLNVK